MAKSVVAQVVELDHLPMNTLRAKWQTLFGTEPPDTRNKRQLTIRLAYRIQELAFGGLSREAREKLEKLAGMSASGIDGSSVARDPDKPVPGTKFIREWQGAKVEVTALEEGFEYAGKNYRSLTAVATEITGTKWNGPDFFGLRRRTTDTSADTQPAGRKSK